MKKISYFIIIVSIFLQPIFSQPYDPGVTEGELSVSLTGAANYTVPIKVIPGINGIQPNISLVYNSQGGNGVAGYGWNISGLSAITRIPATKFHDGFIDGVDLDRYDRYALDGQRLILKSGTYGGNGAIYETENYSNIKIVSYGVHPDGAQYGPAYFKVFYPDGSIATYGQGGSSYGARNKMSWALAIKQTASGLYINYAYINSYNTQLISYIGYGTKLGQAAPYEIRFNYVNKHRREIAYIGGQQIYNPYILNHITVKKRNGASFRNYELEYSNTHLGYQRLVKITEKNGDNSKSLNPIIFEYDDYNGNFSFTHTSSSLGLNDRNSQNTGYVSGDFNGDARMDMILYPKTGTYSRKKLWVKLSDTYNGGGFRNIQEITLSQRFKEILPINWKNTQNRVMGGQGACVITENGTNVRFDIYRQASASAGGGIGLDYSKNISFPIVQKGVSCLPNALAPCKTKYVSAIYPKKYLSGDFDGDGMIEVLAIDKPMSGISCRMRNDNDWLKKRNTKNIDPDCYPEHHILHSNSVYLIDLSRNSSETPFRTGNLGTDIGSSDQIFTADYNGDGKTDIFIFTHHRVRIYSLDRNNQLYLLTSMNDDDIDLTNEPEKIIEEDGLSMHILPYKRPILLGDYNGDGKIDFLIPEKHLSYKWHLYFSTGENLIKKSLMLNIMFYASAFDEYFHRIHTASFITFDLNGDNKTDIISVFNRIKQDNNGNYTIPDGTSINSYENINCDKQGKVEFIKNDPLSINDSNIIADFLPVFLNINQHNFKYEFALLSNNKIHYFKNSYDHTDEVLLRKIKNNGATESIIYKPMADDSNSYDLFTYKPTYNQTYPYVNIQNFPGIKLVTQLQRDMTGYHSKQNYSYFNAVSNLEGLGFMGFQKLLKTNWYDSNHTPISSVSVFEFQKRGAPVLSYTARGVMYGYDHYTPTNYITKTETSYTADLSPTKVFKLRQDWSKSYDKLNNIYTKTSGTYDAYNNPTFQRQIVYNGIGSNNIEKTVDTHIYYEHNLTGGTAGNPYYVGRVRKKTVTANVNNDTYQTEELFSYNNNMLLTQQKKKANQSGYITTNYTYDSYGNILTTTTITPNNGSRTTTATYDNTHRFVSSATDIEGLTTHYTYDSWGNLLTETDPYNRTTQHQYDSWGKITKDIDYLGNETIYTYQRWSNGYHLFWINYPDGHKEFKLLDPLGREERTASLGFRGNWDYIKKEYDIYNKVIKAYEPFDGWNGWPSALYTTYSYDLYGRPTEVRAPNGHTVTYSYNNLSTTVNDNGKTKTIVKNALGQIIKSTDDGGTITYEYYANGKLKHSYFNNVYTRLYYDDWGRKTKIVDPSAGTYTYQYNDWGEVLKETTPKGNTINTYDNKGKLIKKEVQGATPLTSEYLYDTTTKLLTSVNGNGNGNYQYTYDTYKRPKTITETINGNVFKKEFYYDGLGRVYVKKYTSQRGNNTAVKVIKTLFKNGDAYKIVDNDTQQVLWEMNEVNVRGQVVKSTFGNNLVEQNAYDQFGFLLNTATKRNNTNVANIAYSFDTTKGLLTSRTNDYFGITEHFRYDSLDRLIEYTEKDGRQSIQQHQDYLADGRIEENKMGVYHYANDTKPYQNTSIKLSNFGTDYYNNHSLQGITYNAFKAPVSIYERGSGRLDFKYNIFQQRSWKKTVINGIETNKYYSYDGEEEIKVDDQGNIEHTLYISGDAYSAPVIYRKDQNGEKYLYLHRDYLGSIIGVSDQNGQIIEKRAFDAWGGIISIQNAQGNNLNKFSVLDRGYTGHEHLFEVGLIHMNARLYDPLLHRFLAPDNYVQDPYSTQNFNRYGYVLNNPLKYSDPSGEMPFLAAALIGSAISVAVNGISNLFHGKYFLYNWGTAAITGFIGGGMSNLIGNAVAGISGWEKFATQTVSHATLGYVMTAFSGGNPLHGAIAGAFGSMIGAGAGALLKNATDPWVAGSIMAFSGGVAGGIGSAIAGGSFWDGFRNGFISAGLNHAAHRIYQKIKIEKIIQEYENNERIIIKNSMKADVLKNLTQLGQLKKAVSLVVEDWYKQTHFSEWGLSDEITHDLEISLLAMGVTLTSDIPYVKMAAGILLMRYSMENLYLQYRNNYELAPLICRYAPNYAVIHVPNASSYMDISQYIGGGFGGGGATSYWYY